jgi:hypothetical protein
MHNFLTNRPGDLAKEEILSAVGILRDIYAETDRAAVIISAIKLEDLLTRLLKTYLLPPDKKKETFLSNGGPVSNLNAKIELAYRLGLINHDCLKVLRRIKKIRNDFAHTIAGKSLNDEPHVHKIKDLSKDFEKLIKYNELKQIVKTAYPKGKDKPSDDFRIIIYFLQIYLIKILETTTPISGK